MNVWIEYDRWEARMDQATRDAVREGCKTSAATVLPMIFETLGTPSYMLDIGAGEGHWAAAAEQLGVTTHALDLESHHRYGATVYEWNAEALTPMPLCIGSPRWPLALCLEVAEHLTPAAGDHLVAELCRVAEEVVWSAAIPGQGGDGHINEQWPAYWHERFLSNGFALDDPGWRGDLWNDRRVEPWYAQNILLAHRLGRNGQPFEPWVDNAGNSIYPSAPLALVHPVTWSYHRGVPAPDRSY